MGAKKRAQQMVANIRRILIVNSKGGCGKTTVAVNLAVAYVHQGRTVTLIDNDPQQSSSYWAEQRDSRLLQVQLVHAQQRLNMYQTQSFQNRIASDCERLIIDCHAHPQDRELATLIKQSDAILVPLLPASMDIRTGSRFITDLLTHRSFRDAPRPVGVICNRVQPGVEIHDKLRHFLSCMNVPTVATFHDSPIYDQAIDAGRGIFDSLDNEAALAEAAQWRQLIAWIDEQPHAGATTVRELRGRPRAAGAHDADRSLRA